MSKEVFSKFQKSQSINALNSVVGVIVIIQNATSSFYEHLGFI